MKRIFYLILLSIFCGITAKANTWSVDLKRSSWPKFVTANATFAVDFSVTNNGTEAIKTIDVKYSPNGGSAMSVNYKFDEALAVSDTKTVTIDGFVCDVIGKEIFGTFRIDKVNGETNYGSDAYIYVMSGSQYIRRNLVVEEATGRTCGYCPIGIVAMDYMRETYTDGSWIGISVFNDSELRLTGSVYANWYKHVSGTPKAFANRDFGSNYYPTKASLEELYLRMCDAAAVVGIRADVTANAEAKTAKLDVQTYFALDESDANYSISYIITESNLGPYRQYNNYSGWTGDYGGWESRPDPDDCIYNDVARAGSIYDGIAESKITSVKTGENYDFSCEVDLSNVKDLNNACITVMVLNGDGQIENAVRRKVDGSQNDLVKKDDTSSVKDIDQASQSVVVGIYDMQGRRVTSPVRGGIYIERRADGTIRKYRH